MNKSEHQHRGRIGAFLLIVGRKEDFTAADVGVPEERSLEFDAERELFDQAIEWLYDNNLLDHGGSCSGHLGNSQWFDVRLTLAGEIYFNPQ